MSLFEWSSKLIIAFYFRHRFKFLPFSPAPERQTADRILPIIPNEIYFIIFEHIAPPAVLLTPEQSGIFANLSRVCRLFANFCLPRIFEFVEFPGSSTFWDDVPTGLHKYTTYKTLDGTTLCSQIAAKPPLALAIAKTVRVCHFVNWTHDEALDGWSYWMLHMKNIREIKFKYSYVDKTYWNAIATLESLEELSFDSCKFHWQVLPSPPDVESEKMFMIKVSHLHVRGLESVDSLQPLMAAIDPRYLRTVSFINCVDRLSQAALTEVYLTARRSFDVVLYYLEQLHAILMRTRQSLEALTLSVGVPLRLESIASVRKVFENPMWKNMPFLPSLELIVQLGYVDSAVANVRQP